MWFRKGAGKTQAAGSAKASLQRLSMPWGPASGSAERIFVSLASFRDPETRWTVHDLLRKASNPDRLRIAIAWQVDIPSEASIMDLPISASQQSQVEDVALAASPIYLDPTSRICLFNTSS